MVFSDEIPSAPVPTPIAVETDSWILNRSTHSNALCRILVIYAFLGMMVLSGCAGYVSGSSKTHEPPPSPWAPGKSIGNLHLHTTCTDGRNSYEEMAREALRLNMSFIAVTDHQLGGSVLCNEVIQQCRNEKRLLCIPGMEVTGRVHLLAIGIKSRVDNRLPVKKQTERIHKQGGLAIAAHPFRSGNAYSDGELFESGLDAVECRDIPEDKRDDFFAKLRNHSLPCVHNSDAHSVAEMSVRWNVCDGEIKSLDDLESAIRKGQCGR